MTAAVHFGIGFGKVACGYNRWKGGSSTLTSNRDPDAVTCGRCLTAMAAEERAKVAACSCGGRRWVDDENWSPTDPALEQERAPSRGLIPCGFCNFAGWDTPLFQPGDIQ